MVSKFLTTFTLIFCGIIWPGTSSKVYYQQTSTYTWEKSVTIDPIVMTTATKLGCAQECSRRQKCFSFDWDAVSHLCSVDTWNPLTSGYRQHTNDWKPKLYRTCPTNLGCVMRSIEGPNGVHHDQCLYLSTTYKNANDADEQCWSIGGYMYKPNTALKKTLFRTLSDREGFGRMSWIGLRITERGEHTTWSDGQPLTPQEAIIIYAPGCPKFDAEEKCHNFDTYHDAAVDRDCTSSQYLFACEIY